MKAIRDVSGEKSFDPAEINFYSYQIGVRRAETNSKVSSSDLNVMHEAAKQLCSINIACEIFLNYHSLNIHGRVAVQSDYVH